NRVVFNLVDVAKGVCKPNQAIVKSKKSNNLYLLPASQTDDKDVVSEEEIKKVIDLYKREFNFVLIDSPAGIEQGFKNACAAADKAIVVTNPEVSSIRDADRVIGLLAASGIDSRLVINRIDFSMVRRGDMLSVEDVQDILGIDLLGVIEKDESVVIAANCGEPVVYNPKSSAGKAFSRIARRLCGEPVPLTDYIYGQSFWGRLTRRLGVA
ncbi:MAG: septum site-determining protein MinD, partial [Candidatus Dadabacteria bacterium]